MPFLTPAALTICLSTGEGLVGLLLLAPRFCAEREQVTARQDIASAWQCKALLNQSQQPWDGKGVQGGKDRPDREIKGTRG